MSNNKQSSVDFYAEQSLNLFNLFQQGQISINEFRTKMYEVEIQSTKMHKEEITQAWKKGDGEFDNCAKEMSLEYYNENYGGNNDQQ